MCYTDVGMRSDVRREQQQGRSSGSGSKSGKSGGKANTARAEKEESAAATERMHAEIPSRSLPAWVTRLAEASGGGWPPSGQGHGRGRAPQRGRRACCMRACVHLARKLDDGRRSLYDDSTDPPPPLPQRSTRTHGAWVAGRVYITRGEPVATIRGGGEGSRARERLTLHLPRGPASGWTSV